MRKTKNAPQIIFLIIFCAVLFVAWWCWTNRLWVRDEIAYLQYQPSQEIEQIASRDNFADKGKFYFYTSRPQVAKADVFNSTCRDQETNSAVLGCYTRLRISIFDIENAELDGIKEVTAAHEMLHAAYERLSDGEQSSVNKLLEAEAMKLSGDEAFSARMAEYQKMEPGQRDNELHSIIGTEKADISPELENYYKKYFNDRKSVVAMHAKYYAVFEEINQKSKALSDELKSLYDEINVKKNQYAAQNQQLEADIDTFNSRARSGYFTSEAAFQSRRSIIMNQLNAQEVARSEINAMIDNYDAKSNELKQLASRADALNQSIDSKAVPKIDNTPSLSGESGI